jgi:hypothetical protein
VITYAAYLRIYEPVSAFGEPAGSRWAAYADSTARPRRRDCLATENAEALRRIIAAPQVVVPEQESEHAYIRRGDGVTYVCPWQTQLRCLLAYGQMLATGGPPPGTFPVHDEDRAMAALAQLTDEGLKGSSRLHILGSTWTVPLAWFVPFAAGERWLALGSGPGSGSGSGSSPSLASGSGSGSGPSLGSGSGSGSGSGLGSGSGSGSGGDRLSVATRALVYTTPISRARRRVARGLAALRSGPSGDDAVAWPPESAEAGLAGVGRWLEDFHPRSLVELDYGGLVHLLSDDALSGDESVAEIRAAIDGAATGEWGLAVAMYRRASSRWRAFSAFELAN